MAAEPSLDDISKRRLCGWGSENMLQGKKNMASIWETIKSRFRATTFLIPPEGNDTGSGRERKTEGERDGEGKREIISENVLVILIKWKCILSSSY